MRITTLFPLAVLAITTMVATANADLISINFTDNGSAASTMAAADVAGAPGTAGAPGAGSTAVANWNNVTGGASGGSSSLIYDNGSAATGASLSFTAPGNWRLSNASPSVTGDDKMFKGFLDGAGTGNGVTVNVAGLSFVGAYDVRVYVDGDNDASWRVANYTIGATTITNEDSENTNWKKAGGQNTTGIYQRPVAGSGGGNTAFTGTLATNNNEGNYLLFTGVTGNSFTLTGVGGSNFGNNAPRAPINGFQIIGTVASVPEPSSLAMFGLAGLGLYFRRRK